MSTLRAGLRPPRPFRGRYWAVAIPVMAGAAAAGALVAAEPEVLRYLLAGLFALVLVALALHRPRAALVAVFCFLPFLALVRRVLIPEAGWESRDPLLLVAPVVALALIYRLLVLERRPLARDTISKLVIALLALGVVGALNPTGDNAGSYAGEVVVGLGGLLFVSVPLLWYLVGRDVADRRLVHGLVLWVIGSGVFIAAYGLRQTFAGLSTWDAEWIRESGHFALGIHGVTRPFGTFSSSTEYAIYLGVALVFVVALGLHTRRWLLLAAPPLAAGLFLASARSVLLLTIVALLVVALLRVWSARSDAREETPGPPERGLAIAAVAAVALSVLLLAGPPAVDDFGRRSSEQPLVDHQVAGLADPLDSTVVEHWRSLRDGVVEGFTHPIGRGTGTITIAAGRLGETSGRLTDVDVSNVFLGLGLVGGLLFLAIVVLVFRQAIRLYLARPSPLGLAVIGLLVVSGGQWLSAGHYAAAPLLWLLIGWTSAQAGAVRREARRGEAVSTG